MILTVECPECDNLWNVTDDVLRQPNFGMTKTIQCPDCKKHFNVGPLRAHGFIYSMIHNFTKENQDA